METSIVMLSKGEYSDYQAQPFRVLKPFKAAILLDMYKAQWKADPEDKWVTQPNPDGFIGWLTKHGYIEDLDVHEIYLGNSHYKLDPYGQDESLSFEFKPARPV